MCNVCSHLQTCSLSGMFADGTAFYRKREERRKDASGIIWLVKALASSPQHQVTTRHVLLQG